MLPDGRLDRSNFKSPKALSEEEKQRIIDRMSEPDVVDKSLPQAFISVVDNGEYIGSLSTIYRVMKAAGLNTRRDTVRPPQRRHKPSSFEATGPNQVWTWDITFMRDSTCVNSFFYGYVIIDIYSRVIVHAEVHSADNASLACQFLTNAFNKHGIRPRALVLHSDNGSSMKAAETMAVLQEWGVQFSHSRPRVSNDNPYSEAWFKTLKYQGGRYPKQGFRTLEKAREWMDKFVESYNTEHYHSGINFVTPISRFKGEDVDILNKRKQVIEAARKRHPERWISGKVMNCEPAGSQFLNPDKPATEDAEQEKERPA